MAQQTAGKEKHTTTNPPGGESTSGLQGSTVAHVMLEQLEQPEQMPDTKSSLDIIMDVEVPVSAELGRTEMSIGSVLELGPGSIVELNKMASDPVDLYVNNKLIARGEVVVVDENFGIRITSVVESKERIRSLGR